jgi:hypothetical protein
MITLKDMNFHTPENVDHCWGETTYFDVFIPEANIHAWVYLCFRPGVGAVLADVTIVDRQSASLLDALYIDTQNHIPIPVRMDKFSLPNGLRLDATMGPRNYRVDYLGIDRTELHVDVSGLMDPYDIHDPRIDPMAAQDTKAAVEHSGFGQAYTNHFDLTCHVAGELTVRGRRFAVDCISVMDHSWGPRGERGMRSMCWMNANFSKDFAMHGIWSLDPFAPEGAQHEFKHGYALVNGELKGAVSGSLVTRRRDHFTVAAEFKLVDQAGVTYHAVGQVMNYHNWLPYACCLTPTQMMQWRSDGLPAGYGTLMEGMPLDLCTGRRRVDDMEVAPQRVTDE